MKMYDIIAKIERLEELHEVIYFFGIMILTILTARVFVYIHDPNPTLFGFELHHFDYGILLLFMGLQLLYSRPKVHKAFYLTIVAIATGLITDDYWYIRRSVVDHQAIETHVYNSTFPVVVLLTIGMALVTFAFQIIRKRQRQ